MLTHKVTYFPWHHGYSCGLKCPASYFFAFSLPFFQIKVLVLHRKSNGKVLEWLKRHAWKACNRLKRFVGSNPILSAGWASGLSWNARSICFYKYIHFSFICCFNGGTIIPPMEVQSYSQWKCNRIPNGGAIVLPMGRQSCSHWEGNRIPTGKTVVFPVGKQSYSHWEDNCLDIRKPWVFI